MGVMRPELVMKSIVPVVMAGVLGIYGLIIAVIISTGSEHPRPLGTVFDRLSGKGRCTRRRAPDLASSYVCLARGSYQYRAMPA